VQWAVPRARIGQGDPGVVDKDDALEDRPAVDVRLLNDAIQGPLDVTQAGLQAVLHRHAQRLVGEEALQGAVLPQALDVAAAFVEEVAQGGRGLLEGVLMLRAEQLAQAMLAAKVTASRSRT